MKEYTYCLPESLIRNPSATKNDLIIYGLIGCLQGKQVYSVKKLVEWSQIPRSSVFKSLNRLEELGYLEKTASSYKIASKEIVQSLIDETPTVSRTRLESLTDETQKSHRRDSTLYIDNTKDNTMDIEEAKLPTKRQTKFLSSFSKDSISKDEMLNILNDPSLCDGDKSLARYCYDSMKDWALSNGIKKQDWPATLRNWIRKEIKDKQRFNKRPTTFSEAEDMRQEEISKKLREKYQKTY